MGFVPVIVSHGKASSLSNPCPDGTGIGYITLTNSSFLNNTILVICDAAFNDNKPKPDNLALGLGLGLGLGIPVILLLIWACAFQNQLMCYNREYHSSPPPPPPSPEELQRNAKVMVMKYLSNELYAQFLEGNLSIELKKELQKIKDHNGESVMATFVLHATHCNHIIMADWIKNLTFTTLQDEGIV